MRDLTTVIDEMLPYIPEEYDDVRRGLMGIQHRLLYAAPEIHRGYWFQAAEVLCRLGPPDNAWKQRVADVFADRGREGFDE